MPPRPDTERVWGGSGQLRPARAGSGVVLRGSRCPLGEEVCRQEACPKGRPHAWRRATATSARVWTDLPPERRERPPRGLRALAGAAAASARGGREGGQAAGAVWRDSGGGGAVGHAGAGSAGGVTVEDGRRTPLFPGAEFLERANPTRCCAVSAGNASRLFCDLSILST